jgi:hypothetical protein
LTKAFDSVVDDATQQSIKGSIDKLGLATELCHEEVCNWVYVSVSSKFDRYCKRGMWVKGAEMWLAPYYEV